MDEIQKNKERFERKVQEIRNHPDLSAEAKRRYLGEAYAEAKAEHDRLRSEHEAEQERTIKDLERKVFKVNFPLSVSTQEKEMIRLSYQDAYDRAERVVAAGKEGPERNQALKALLDRAERAGDAQQADAVYHLARERGMWDVADAYLADRPEAKETWENYTAARQEAESLENQLFGWVPPREPHELGRAATAGARIHELRAGAADDRST